MRKAVDVTLIVGFLAVDFLLFHDLFKPSEKYNLVQYLTGVLSLPVLAIAVQSLWRRAWPEPESPPARSTD